MKQFLKVAGASEISIWRDEKTVEKIIVEKIMVEKGETENLEALKNLRDDGECFHINEFCCGDWDNCTCDQESRSYQTISDNILYVAFT